MLALHEFVNIYSSESLHQVNIINPLIELWLCRLHIINSYPTDRFWLTNERLYLHSETGLYLTNIVSSLKLISDHEIGAKLFNRFYGKHKWEKRVGDAGEGYLFLVTNNSFSKKTTTVCL